MTNITRKPYIAGNWKMNLDRSRALDLIKTIKGRLGDGSDREVAVYVPSVYLADVAAVAQGSPLGVGAQNIHFEEEGAFTGETSCNMVREVGADRTLVGHSERRHVFGEPDEWMGRKILTALGHGVLPILCVGETLDERQANRTDRVIKRQLEAGFALIDPEQYHLVSIAYEPVWAIGTGEVANLDQIASAHGTVRKFLSTKIEADMASQVRILYGGSVSPDNAASIMSVPDVDGMLVGGASLQPDTFIPIIEYNG
jgi:triosephosphate isomerase (TIM)